jgi:hypothetical protein
LSVWICIVNKKNDRRERREGERGRAKRNPFDENMAAFEKAEFVKCPDHALKERARDG